MFKRLNGWSKILKRHDKKKHEKIKYTSYEHLDSRYNTNMNELRSTTQTTESQ